MQQMMARFRNFTAYKKSRFELKRGKKAQCVSTRCKDLFERKKYFGVRCTLTGLTVQTASLPYVQFKASLCHYFLKELYIHNSKASFLKITCPLFNLTNNLATCHPFCFSPFSLKTTHLFINLEPFESINRTEKCEEAS